MRAKEQVRRWRETYPTIEIEETALLTMASFPSLYASDFAVYCEQRGLPPEVRSFVKEITVETRWAYDNWKKAQRDGNAAALIADLLNGANGGGGPEAELWAFVQRYIRDYAKANNIPLGDDQAPAPWMELIPAGEA